MKLKQPIAKFLRGIANKLDPQSKKSQRFLDLPPITGIRFEEQIAHIDTIAAEHIIPADVPMQYVERGICDGIAQELLNQKFIKIEAVEKQIDNWCRPVIKYRAYLKVVRPL